MIGWYGCAMLCYVTPKRFHEVIGGDAQVGIAVLDHLENGLQHADERAVRDDPCLC